jgi:M6 family metalloprotease-like protein
VAGSQKFVTILCRFADATSITPHPKSWFEPLFMGTSYPSLDHHWRENSFNTINLVGSSVAGWYNLPQPRSYYVGEPTDPSGVSLAWGRAFDDSTNVADADVFFPSFFGINLVFNQGLDCCAWGVSGWNLTLDGQTKSYGVTWVGDGGYHHSVFAHEMGHTFGLPHSYASATAGNDWDGGGICSVRHADYGCVSVHNISDQKDRLAWIPPERRYVAAPDSDSTITLRRLAQPALASGDYLMARIPIPGSSTRYYTVEARRLIGYDGQIPGEAVVIHDVDPTRSEPAHLIDADGNGNPRDAGAMWAAGETFADAANAISVSVLSGDASGYRVRIRSGSPPTAPSPIRVNSGGGAYTDGNGNVWKAENGCTGGWNQNVAAPIEGTDADPLYQSARTGVSFCSYAVPNGTYTVSLKFAELVHAAAGRRKFDVRIENQLVLDDFDIFALAGKNDALDQTFSVPVADGALSINFVKLVDNPVVAAIEITGDPVAPPSQVSNLRASAASSSATRLEWDYAGPHVNTFEIMLWTGSQWQFLARVGGGERSWSETGLAPGTGRTYTVDAINSAGEASGCGNPCLHASATTATEVAPTVVDRAPAHGATDVAIGANVTAIFSEGMRASSITTATFTLTKQGGGAVAAAVAYADATRTATLNPTANLQPNTTYIATLKGSIADAAGNAMGSDVAWSFTTQACVPTNPPPQTLTPGQPKTGAICPAGQVDLYSFTGNAGQQARIRMSSTAGSSLQPYLELWDCCTGSGTRLAQSAAADPSIQIALPYTGTYAVRAGSFQQASIGGYSIELTLTTPGAVPVPQEPGAAVGGAVPMIDTLQPAFRWSAVDGATSYRLQVSTAAGFSSFAINATTGTNSYAMPSWQSLARGTQYYWRVQAGVGDWSTTLTFRTPAVPAVPALVNPANGATVAGLTPTLDWGDVPGAAKYHVQVATNSWFGTRVVDEDVTADSQYAVPAGKLAPNTTYYWRVNAANAAGTSAYSVVRTFKTPP